MTKRRQMSPLAVAVLAVIVIVALFAGAYAVWGGRSDDSPMSPLTADASDGSATQVLDRDPHPTDQTLPEFDPVGVRMPLMYEEREILVPDWATTWQHADGVYLSAREVDSALEFMAVDSTGKILWVADRPLSCTGFAISEGPGGEPIAVLTDTDATEDAFSSVTASAYDLRTGAELWGPVEVPGPYQGPGLVFAASPEDFMGDSGQRIALDPATGEIFGAEGLNEVGQESRVVAEYGGVVLVVNDSALEGRNASDGSQLWSINLAEQGWNPSDLHAVVGERPLEGFVMLAVTPTSRALINVDEGTVLNASTLGFAYDTISSTLVIHDDVGLHAYGPGGVPMWEFTVQPGTRIEALGGALLYLREGDTVRSHNVISGQLAQAYDPLGEGIIIVPLFIAPDGSVLLSDGSRELLGTIEPVPDFATDEG